MRGSASTLPPPIVHKPARPNGGDPPALDADSGGGGTGWVQLARARNDIEAHLLSGRLNEAGVETSCLTDRNHPGAWLHGGSDPRAPVTIFVKKIQLEDARLVLAEISWAQPSVDPSPQFQPESNGRAFAVTWWVAAIVLGVLFTSIALARTGAVLHNCELPLVCGSGESGTLGE